jgi:hypothetical protein
MLPVLVGTGLVLAAIGSAPSPPEHDFYRYASVLTLILIVNFRIARDRDLGFDEFMISNFVTPRLYVAGKTVALLILLILVGVYGCAVSTLLSGGDLAFASWHALRLTLVGWVFSPPALLVEMAIPTRMPMVYVILGYVVVALGLVGAGGDVDPLLHFFGLGSEPLSFGGLSPLLVRAGVAAPLAFALLHPLCCRRLRIWNR